MKKKRTRVYISLFLALLVFWSVCMSVLFFRASETAQELAMLRADTARADFDDVVLRLMDDMGHMYVRYGGDEAPTLDEMYPVVAAMTGSSTDEHFCIMDPSGYLYADYGRLINWLGEDVKKTVSSEGYAVTYIHEIFDIRGAIAIVTPAGDDSYYSLVRVVSTDSFSRMLSDEILEPFEYVAVFNGWGDLMVLQAREGLEVTDAAAHQAATIYANDGQTLVSRLNIRYDYDAFTPVSQPGGWFLSIRIRGGDLMPTFGTQLVIQILAMAVTVGMAGMYILWDIRRVRRSLSGQSGDIDPLTGLYTLNGFETAVHAFFRRTEVQDYCLVYMDIASFRRFNVMFGHKMGDLLLQTIGGCVKKNFYIGARPNSDIFVFIIKAADNIKQDVEQPIKDAVQTSLGLQYLQMISLNFGVYPLLQDRFNFREASDGAMMALRHAKTHAEGNEVIYDLAMLKEDRMNRHMEVNMLHALSRAEFKMYIQPKFETEDARCCGGEALVRWQSDQMGLLLSNQFVPLFERNGFIVEVDFFMLESILKFQQEGMKKGWEMLPVSVNQSRVTISLPNYLERVKDLVKRYDVPLRYVSIEITESILTENYDIVVPLVAQLKEIGFAIDMDDFGKGYSSLSVLRELPVDVLKIDKEFLRESDTSQRGRRIIESVINMAGALGIKTVCEGVETGMQLDFLRKSGCDMVQGYYLARPMHSSEYAGTYLTGNRPSLRSSSQTPLRS